MVAKNAHPEKTFADGYNDGFKEGSGLKGVLPSLPAYSVPAGYTAYGIGYERGLEAGKARKQ